MANIDKVIQKSGLALNVTENTKAVEAKNYTKTLEIKNEMLTDEVSKMRLLFAELSVYLEKGMDEVKEQNNVLGVAEGEYLKKIAEAVNTLETSNNAVNRLLEEKLDKFKVVTIDAVRLVIDKNAEGAKSSIRNFEVSATEALAKFSAQMNTTLEANKKVSQEIQYTYQFQGYKTIGLYVWRWLTAMGILYMLQTIFKIDSFGSWIKVLTGIALF